MQEESSERSCRKDTRQLSEKIEDLTEESRTHEEAVEKIRRELVRQNQQTRAGPDRFTTEKHSRLESLKNITERYDGYGGSIRRVMEVRDPGNRGIHGVVADLINVRKSLRGSHRDRPWRQHPEHRHRIPRRRRSG